MGAIYGYILMAAIFVGVTAGAYVQGRTDGAAKVKVEWSNAVIAAKDEAEATRKADQEKARRAARALEGRLATANQTSRELSDALSKAIIVKPLPSCPIPDSVRDLWNAANRGEGATGAKLSDSAATIAAPTKPVP